MVVVRVFTQKIKSRLSPGKAVILMGSRQPGKSTLLTTPKKEYTSHASSTCSTGRSL